MNTSPSYTIRQAKPHEAGPHAEALHLKMGAVQVGQRGSKVKGRFLPQMRYRIPQLKPNA